MRAPVCSGSRRQTTDVLRLCPRCPARAVGLLVAACLLLAFREAEAQSAPAYPDPFAPQLEANPRKPPRFEKQAPGTSKRSETLRTFTPPASGAGATGFDATNARKKPGLKPKSGAATTTPPLQAGAAQPLQPGATQAPQPARSPYQVPQIPETQPSNEANTALAEAPPGTPPVPEIGPIRKPPPKRKAHPEPLDPYDPLGIRAGAFDIYPAVEFIAGYDTNPGQSQTPSAAWLYTVQPELRVQSDWSRHELKADLRGSYTGFSPSQTPKLDRPYFAGKVDGRIDVTRNTRVDLEGRTLVATDNPGSPNLQAGLSKLPIYTSFGATGGLGQRFNRFDVSLKGDVDRTVYQNSELTDGTTASNDDRNYNQYGGRLRGGYELLPGAVPFAEFDADTRKHDLNTDFSGFQRDSTGMTGKAGTTFEMRGFLTGEVALGYTTRKYQDQRLEDVNGLVGNASLVWTASALTTVKLAGTTTVGESTIPGVSGALSRDVGLQVDHSFRRWLIGTAKLGFGQDDYVGLDRLDNRYSAAVGLTYKFNRSLQLKGEIDQNWLRSNQSGNDYNETIFLLGIRVQR